MGVKDSLWLIVVGAVTFSVGVARYAVKGSPATGNSHATCRLRRSPHSHSGGAANGARATSALRAHLATHRVVLADLEGVLAADNVDAGHSALASPALHKVLTERRPQVLPAPQLACPQVWTSSLRTAVVAPLEVEGKVVDALAGPDSAAPAGLLRLTSEVARFVSRSTRTSRDDDGAGGDPSRMRRIPSGTAGEDPVGPRNVDARLKAVFGGDDGLLVKTGLDAGTRGTIRPPTPHPPMLPS